VSSVMSDVGGMLPHPGGLGRRVPTDWKHVEKYPFSAVAPTTPEKVERVLRMPSWAHLYYNQAAEGACVGFGESQMMSILNHHRYDARWLWNVAKLIDEWADTNPGDDNGTSVRAGCDVLRLQGHVQVLRGKDQEVNPAEGIAANRWATKVDEIRASIAAGVPVALGINWYDAFDYPSPYGSSTDYFVGHDRQLGNIRGGHCVCAMGASDRRQAICFTNNWGADYPRKVWLPYPITQRLIDEDVEAAIVTDR